MLTLFLAPYFEVKEKGKKFWVKKRGEISDVCVEEEWSILVFRKAGPASVIGGETDIRLDN